MLVRLLRQRGHDVEAVGTGQVAVEAMQRQTCDLALMDCQTPGMDDYISKPIDLVALDLILGRWSGRTEPARDA